MPGIDELRGVRHIKLVNFDRLKEKHFKGVSIDSRTVRSKEIFFAIKGEKTDGHEYIDAVFKKKAALVVVNEGWFRRRGAQFKNGVFLVVRDSTKALGEFAKLHKKNLNVPTLCIGGSNGKTTTKDLTAAVLSQKYNVLKTEGNFNNHIGLPLTLLKLTKEHNFCVLEVGCNHFGEIKYLCEIADPDYGLITNIGKEHLEFFKDIHGVARAEFELFDYLRSKKYSRAFLNFDDRFIKKYSKKIRDEKKFSYSYNHDTDVKGRFKDYSKNFEPKIEISFGKTKFETAISTFGKHSIYNGLAAVAAGIYFDVSAGEIRKALQNFRSLSSKRMEILNFKGVTIINDTYNSNPESVRMGLETMLEFDTRGKKYAVLSDMLELGKSSRTEHSEIGKFASQKGIENLYTYGNESIDIFRSAKKIRNNFYFEDKTDLIEMLRKNLMKDDVVYIKGSRGMKMEEVVNGIIEK